MCGGVNIRIFSLEEAKAIEDKKNSIVVVGVRDIRNHEIIAEEMYTAGFKFIIYLSNGIRMKPKIDALLRSAYNNYYKGNFQNTIVPEYTEGLVDKFCNDFSILNCDHRNITVRCPRELLYSLDDKIVQGERTWDEFEKDKVGMDSLPLDIMPYKDLILFSDHVSSDIEKYINYKYSFRQRSDRRWSDRELIEERINICRLYIQNYERGMSFFESSASIGIWNDNGYFNLQDGHHRSSFLLSRGHKYIPLIISKEDYIKWENRDKLEIVKEYLSEEEDLIYSVEHPNFINWNIRDGYQSNSLLSWIQFEYWKEKKCKTVIDMTRSWGYYARNLYKIGRSVQRCRINKDCRTYVYCESKAYMEQAKAINDMLYCENIIYLSGINNLIEKCSESSIVITDNFLEGVLSKDKLFYTIMEKEPIIVIWSSSLREKHNLQEKKYEYKGSYEYIKIFDAYQNDFVEIGMFVKRRYENCYLEKKKIGNVY